MTSTPSSTAIVPFDSTFADPRMLALDGFLASYSGLTRDPYALDLRQFLTSCDEHRLDVFAIRRFDIETFARDLEARGRARATVARRLCTVDGFYRYAEEEGLLAHSPAVNVRRPRIDYERHATALDRNEVGALLVAAGLDSTQDHALVSLLALNGLRVCEAIGADTDQLGLARGHRTLTITRKGGKIVPIPRAPRTARPVDPSIGERLEGPIFTDADGARLDRHAAGRIVRRVARRAGITKPVGPHTCATRSSPRRSTPASRSATCRSPRRTPIRARQCGMTGPGSPSTGTPPTSSPPSSPTPPANPTHSPFGRPQPRLRTVQHRRSGTMENPPPGVFCMPDLGRSERRGR